MSDNLFNRKITDMLIEDEGMELKLYKCTAGKWTIGVGHNIEDKGISEDVAMFILSLDIKEAVADLVNIFNDYYKLPENVRLVLINMRFQLGSAGFQSFKNMIRHVSDFDYLDAAKEMKHSKWFYQTPERAKRLIDMMVQEGLDRENWK